jgi:ABC-type glycerol-3-phosphate transport system permease component
MVPDDSLTPQQSRCGGLARCRLLDPALSGGDRGSLCSAARVDRCSEFGVYWHIILLLIKPALVVLGIYTFMTQWMSFLWPLVATTSNDMYVLTVGVQSIKTIYTTDWGLISAGSVLTMIPITIVFILLQRYFIAASIAGALKS